MADTWKEDKVGANIINKTKKTNFGFSDPTGEHPLPEYHQQPSVNKQAVGADINTVDINGGDPSIDIFDLLGSYPSSSNYTDVSVKKTKSGHVLTFDDTLGQEHILLRHKDGSGFMLKADGTMIHENVTEAEWLTGKEDGVYDTDTTWSASHTQNLYQGIDQSKLVPLLVKTIQELEARITTLENV